MDFPTHMELSILYFKGLAIEMHIIWLFNHQAIVMVEVFYIFVGLFELDAKCSF